MNVPAEKLRKPLAALLTAAALLSQTFSVSGVTAAGADYSGKDTVAESMAHYGAGYTSVLYDGKSGLPTSEANAIAQSSSGMIWIGGYSGLTRYDGNDFYRYDSSTGVASVVSLYVDSEDRLWIGTNDSGVVMLVDNEFKFYGAESGLNSLSIRSIVEDDANDIILGTTMGLAYIDGKTGELVRINEPQVNKEYICELVSSSSGTIFGVTLSGGIFTVSNKRVTAYYDSESLGIGVVNTVYPDPEDPGKVWLGSQESSVYSGSPDDSFRNLTEYVAGSLNPINCIRLIDGRLWICADNGIGFFDSSMEYIELYDLPMTNSVDHLITDYEGNLWFSSSRQGIMKIVNNIFTNLSRIAGLPTAVVNTTCRSGSDLYIGTDNGLFIMTSSYELVENDLTALLKNIRIRCIRSDTDGNLWLCTYSSYGAVRYDPGTGEYRLFDESSGMLSNRTRMVKILSDGSVAIATNAGVNIIRGDEIVDSYDSSDGISNLEILCIEEGKDGKLFLGSDGHGIYVAEDNKMSRIGVGDGLKSEVILRIKKDDIRGVYWIITSNSIAYMTENGRVKTLSNFPYSNNFDMYFDALGRIWVLSSNGIYVVKGDVMIEDEDMAHIVYTTQSGLPAITTANSFSHLDDDGMLYIACSTGICSVNINSDLDNNRDIKLSVPFIIADDRFIGISDYSKPVVISSDCKRVSIYGNAFTYSLGDPTLSYCLEGFDDSPITVRKHEMDYARYTNLHGGTYKFRLSLINTLTGEIDKSVVVTIVKEKAFYETPLFYILSIAACVILVVGVMSLIMIFRTQKMRKEQETLKKQAEYTQELIDELAAAFAKCVDLKDAYTNGHSLRVAKYSAMLARELGKPEDEIRSIYDIALLHDIGKIFIPDNILNKPGRLDDDEFKVMQTHAQKGYEILREVKIAPELADGAGYHHLRYDCKGYPIDLPKKKVPEVARIIAVADTFDAMYSSRPYRSKMPLEKVVAEIKRCSGSQLAPDVVDAFVKLYEEGAFGDGSEASDVE